MFKPTYSERIIHKMKEILNRILRVYHQRKLTNTDFTIIANNCWGGICYEYFGLEKKSPTIGTYFFAEDFLKFAERLEYYVSQEIRFIKKEQSKHYKWLMNEKECPIGVLDDVEIIFLHYADEKIAKEKWERRVKRINWNNLIFKFSYMNNCTKEHLKVFDEMNLQGKKFMFISTDEHKYDCGIVYPGYEKDTQIWNDTWYWNKYLDVIGLINETEA